MNIISVSYLFLISTNHYFYQKLKKHIETATAMWILKSYKVNYASWTKQSYLFTILNLKYNLITMQYYDLKNTIVSSGKWATQISFISTETETASNISSLLTSHIIQLSIKKQLAGFPPLKISLPTLELHSVGLTLRMSTVLVFTFLIWYNTFKMCAKETGDTC